MAVLMLSVFTVSMGFGVLLPLLPYLIERLLGTGGDAAQVSRATGLLTGLYMLSLFLFAPIWGRMSDRYGRRPILLIGLIGFSATMLTFAFIGLFLLKPRCEAQFLASYCGPFAIPERSRQHAGSSP